MRKRVIFVSAIALSVMLLSCGGKNGAGENAAQSAASYADDSFVAVEEEIAYVPEENEPRKESEEESVRKFVMDMYAVVLPAVAKGNGDKYISRYCDENFTEWIKGINEYDRENHPGEIGLFDCEFWTRSQDPDLNIRPTIKSVRFEDDFCDNEYAVVKVSLKGEYYPATEVYIQLYHRDDGWRIADYDGMLMDMKSYISTDE